MGLQFIIRAFTQTDRAFVADSWLNSLRAGTEESKSADWPSFKAAKNAAIDRILDAPSTRILVAAPPNDDVTIYGYLAFRHEPDAVLHMLFVKKPFRGQGVATRLMEDAPSTAICTQWTADMGEWILRAKRLTYNPWAIGAWP